MKNNTMTTRGKISTLTIQYIAGFFDGEGCINIYQRKKGIKKDKTGYTLTASIYNTNKNVMNKIKESFGGRVRARKRYIKKWKIAYEWILSSNQALIFLKKVFPFLVVKKTQAQTAIEFQELCQKKIHRFAPNIKEVDDFYELCYQKMRLLNKKGIKSYYPQRLNEETLKREATVRAALKNAEIGRNDLSALREIQNKGGYACLQKYGREHYIKMRSKVKK